MAACLANAAFCPQPLGALHAMHAPLRTSLPVTTSVSRVRAFVRRLLLDRRHRSVALVAQSGQVLGGITYRVFGQVRSTGEQVASMFAPHRPGRRHPAAAQHPGCIDGPIDRWAMRAVCCHCVPQGLGEIAFCAVAANQQVRGFGTRLMNHTKAMARDRDGLTHFLTYADNNAVGYFTKQVCCWHVVGRGLGPWGDCQHSARVCAISATMQATGTQRAFLHVWGRPFPAAPSFLLRASRSLINFSLHPYCC